jgi:V/A-type H+-transporting ATPase subunit A
LREISNKLEELPGPDAFPMDLTSIISSFYARSGKVILNNNATGSVTFIGTVSPAGGNLKEPVTEATRKAARCFYALSQKRADSKRYPAIDPVDSYSKYLEYAEVREFATKNLSPEYISNNMEFKNYLLRGRDAAEQINILGDDGVPLNTHLDFWRSEIIDFAFLQQDAFDKVDAYTPMNRQIYMMELILKICKHSFNFSDFNQIHSFFKDIINHLKQMNYAEFNSELFLKHQANLEEALGKISGE